MGALEGRVALITGAGRGMGREHARAFAAEGASVVVNDSGAGRDGTGRDAGVSRAVAEELLAQGAAAVANSEDVTTLDGASRAVGAALERWGRLDALVNNAGVLRDRMFVNMTEDDWDTVVAGHLRSTFCTTRVAAGHWRDRSKAGEAVDAAVVNVSSTSGLFGAIGQSNYGAAKAGVAAVTVILAEELGRYGVRVNGIAPAARTRLTESTPGLGDIVKPPAGVGAFDIWDPANVSPLVAWLATENCPATGKVFFVQGGTVKLMTGWTMGDGIERDERWTVAELDAKLAPFVS